MLGLLRKAARANDEILALVLGEAPVFKAIDPLDPEGYLLIVSRLAAALRGVSEDDEKAAISDALAVLDVDWSSLSPEAVDGVVAATNEALRSFGEKAVPKIAEVLEVEGPRLWGSTRAAAKRKYDFDIEAAFSQRDLDAEKAIRTTTTNFVRDELGRRAGELSARAREIAARGVERGFGNEQIAKDLAEGLPSITRGPSYFRVVAHAFVNKGRSWSQLGAYHNAGVKQFVFEAILDEVTSDICRFLSGKVFSVPAAIAHIERVSKLEDPDEVYHADPWVSSGRDEDGSDVLYVKDKDGDRRNVATVERSGEGTSDDPGEFSSPMSDAKLESLGIPVPPRHGHCRSTIVPVL